MVESLSRPNKNQPPGFLLDEFRGLRGRAGGAVRAARPAPLEAGSLTDELIGHLLTGVFEGGKINGCHSTDALEQLITAASGRKLIAIEDLRGAAPGGQTVRVWRIWEAPTGKKAPKTEPARNAAGGFDDDGWIPSPIRRRPATTST